MLKTEIIFFWAAFVLYILAWVASIAYSIFHKEVITRAGFVLVLCGLVAHFISLTVRSLAVGHLPLFGTYENSQVAGWFLIFFTLIFSIYYPRLKVIGIVSYLWGILLVLWSMKFNRHLIPLTISEQSLWVDFHVLFAWMAFSSFFIAWGIAFFMIFKKKVSFHFQLDYEELSDLLLKYLAFGLTTYTVMISLGAVYEYMLFGHWWQWDIVETLSLIMWILYGLIIHLLLFYKNKTRLSAWITLFAPVGLLVSYLGLSVLNVLTFHNFDLPF